MIFTTYTAQAITFIFAHGYGRTGTDAGLYTKNSCYFYNDVYQKNTSTFLQEKTNNDWYILPEQTISFDFPWVMSSGKANKNLVSFGQKTEYETLMQKCALNDDPEGIILVGYSLGASSCLIYAALQTTHNIKAIILIAAFDTIEQPLKNILYERYGLLTYIPGFYGGALYVFQNKYPLYNALGITPLQACAHIPSTIPILIVHSIDDELTPITSAFALYDALKTAEHQNVYSLYLPTGIHRKMYMPQDFTSNTAYIFRNGIHAFYELHNLPCDTSFAKAGIHFLI